MICQLRSWCSKLETPIYESFLYFSPSRKKQILPKYTDWLPDMVFFHIHLPTNSNNENSCIMFEHSTTFNCSFIPPPPKITNYIKIENNNNKKKIISSLLRMTCKLQQYPYAANKEDFPESFGKTTEKFRNPEAQRISMTVFDIYGWINIKGPKKSWSFTEITNPEENEKRMQKAEQ